MEKYIDQILADLKAAVKNVPDAPDFGDTEESFTEAMDSIVHAPEQEPKKMFGVSYEELPPVEKLNESQMQRLVEAIIDTLDAFGVSVHLKDNMPTAFRYKILRNRFKDSIPYMPGWNIDFCTGSCPDCEILDYCDGWKNIWTKEELEAEQKKWNNKTQE